MSKLEVTPETYDKIKLVKWITNYWYDVSYKIGNKKNVVHYGILSYPNNGSLYVVSKFKHRNQIKMTILRPIQEVNEDLPQILSLPIDFYEIGLGDKMTSEEAEFLIKSTKHLT